MKPVELLILGAGSRGTAYSDYALEHPEQARIVGVAEPRDFYRTRIATNHQVPPEQVTTDWRELAARSRFADAVIIATQDAMHLEPALAFAQKGYAILLEKPMAPDPASCQRIVDAVIANNTLFGVCHVLRYTNYTQQLKALLDRGTIGDILSIQHVEPVGYWHYAHSFVRGNWRNERLSSPMLLAKSCHDLDWLRCIMGQPCIQVSSFGSLMHFRHEAKPAAAGAATRCLDCAYETDCPYSAKRFYFQRLASGSFSWPIDIITTDFTDEGVLKALRDGPYGRCVYECDNDVVDHQVVNLLYENGATATFTMIATSEARERLTTIYGTRGELRGNGSEIVHYDFLSNTVKTLPIEHGIEQFSGHGGGDYRLMQHFIEAVSTGDRSKILSGPRESLETHLTVFAAEQARHEQRVVQIQ